MKLEGEIGQRILKEKKIQRIIGVQEVMMFATLTFETKRLFVAAPNVPKNKLNLL